MAAAAVLAGARSMTAIAEWAADAPQVVRAALGARREAPECWVVPSEATIRRTLARLDADALAACVGAWLADRNGPDRRRRAVAVDGKTLRGAKRDGRQVHLLSAMEHATRAVLAQREVDGAPGEVGGFVSLLADLDLAGTVVTADALHTHREHADWLVAVKQADYLFTVKANQPTLLERCAGLAWHHVRVLDRTRDRAHGRVEIRILKVVSVRGFGGFPHVCQVLQVIRKTRPLPPPLDDHGRVCGHQPAPRPGQPRPPGRPHPWPLGHRNGLHYVRDVTFAEDASQVRTGNGPQVMVTLRNLVIGALCRAGPVNLAAALRHHSRNPCRPLATLGIRLG